ncbi:retrotransposon protein, putative, ty1-copia subclass [Tanacetum coccineum]
MSSIAKFDVEKFDGSNDFGLWHVKMRCLLIQHGWEAALDPFPETMTDANKTAALKTDVYKKAHNLALMLLTSLPPSYDNFVETLLYGRELTPLEDVLSSHSIHRDGSGMHSKGYDNGDLLMAVSEERFLEWIMNSSGSFHMTPKRGFLFDFKEFNGGTVLLGDNRACAIMGIGKVRVRTKDGSSFMLENVRYIPELKRNLISLGTLNREGYTMKLQNGRVKVIKGSLMVLSGTMKGNCVYSLDGWAKSGEASIGQHTTEGVIDYVHADLWGPSQVESMSGCRYFLSIVDDYSRRVWVHFLRHKNETFNKLKEWKQLVENQIGRKLKKLRTDNGLEFCNKEFNDLCKESGMARNLTVARTPQQNGIAERMNWMLLNKVRCLLIQSGLPYSFWAEATVTTAYLISRSPSTALEKKTPMDLWSGHPVNYEMLRIFGCVAFSHVNQRKLKPRAIKCIFLGYPEGVKGYRLWRLDDVKPKIIISRDVVFNESLMYKDTLKGAGAADSGKEVEFEVELQGSMVKPTMDPHTRENLRNEDEEQDEGPQQQNLDNYVLVRDRAKRTTTIPARYRDEGNVSLSRPSGSKVDDMAAYAFAIAEEEDTHEPITFQEAINSSEKDEWLEQLDVKTAFLHGNLEETIYMRQPPGFEEGTGNKVCLLKKSLYGLKQSPRQWYKRFDVYMISNGFSRSNYDSCVYFKEFAPGMYIYLLLYVDDMLIACKSKSEIEYTKGLLQKEFDMKELGPARKILGMEIVRDRGSRTLKVSQSGYVQKILNNYRVDNGKSVSVPLGAHFKVSLKDCSSNDWDVERMSKVPYANAVGSLMYLMVCTRPDIAYVVSIVSRYLTNPGKNHWEAVKWILKYLKGTADVGLVYGRDQGKHVDVDGFVDADYAKDPDKEAEYMALTEAVKESIWLKGLLIELGVNLREIMESKEIGVAKIGTKDNAVDAFTKVVPDLQSVRLRYGALTCLGSLRTKSIKQFSSVVNCLDETVMDDLSLIALAVCVGAPEHFLFASIVIECMRHRGFMVWGVCVRTLRAHSPDTWGRLASGGEGVVVLDVRWGVLCRGGAVRAWVIVVRGGGTLRGGWVQGDRGECWREGLGVWGVRGGDSGLLCSSWAEIVSGSGWGGGGGELGGGGVAVASGGAGIGKWRRNGSVWGEGGVGGAVGVGEWVGGGGGAWGSGGGRGEGGDAAETVAVWWVEGQQGWGLVGGGGGGVGEVRWARGEMKWVGFACWGRRGRRGLAGLGGRGRGCVEGWCLLWVRFGGVRSVWGGMGGAMRGGGRARLGGDGGFAGDREGVLGGLGGRCLGGDVGYSSFMV